MRVIAVDGVAPGIGKSTLAAALAVRLHERGSVVEHFREEDILSRPAFGAVARQFQETGRVEPVLLLSATERYLRDLRHDGVGVAVLDSLLPFVPSLLAWGHDLPTITAFVRDLTGILAQTRPLLVYLYGPVGAALERAVHREGEAWLSWLIGRYAGAADPVTDLPSLHAHLDSRRRLTLRMLADCGWNLLVVADAHSRGTEEIVAMVSAHPWECGRPDR